MGTLSEWIKWNLPAVSTGQYDELLGKKDYLDILNRNQMATIMELRDQLAGKELELATLKNKIVERAQVPPILRAKSSADVRRMVEQANEAEFEEQANA